MQLLLDPNSQDVLVSVSTDEHSHIAMGRLPALNPQSRAKVLELLERIPTGNMLSTCEA